MANYSSKFKGVEIDKLLSDVPKLPGKTVAGEEFTVDGTKMTAKDDAEIFNSGNTAIGLNSHAEGGGTLATGDTSHSEGGSTRATGNCAHSEGGGTLASGVAAHAEGAGTQATGNNSHSEGSGTRATGDDSHAEGAGTLASGMRAHAEGLMSKATGTAAHAEGMGTTAESDFQHALGKYNISDSNQKYAFIIGNGTADGSRQNAFAIDWNGNIYVNNAEIGINVNDLMPKSAIVKLNSIEEFNNLTDKTADWYFIKEG